MPSPLLIKISGPGTVRDLGMRSLKALPITPRQPLPNRPSLVIRGATLDSAGAPLPACVVKFFRTADDAYLGAVTSDGSGKYTSPPVGLDLQHYAVAYLPGSPDVAGTTKNTLLGT